MELFVVTSGSSLFKI